MFVIKAKIPKPQAKIFKFTAQKTMYGGKKIGKGDAIFMFASENEGGHGLLARGIVISSILMAKKHGIGRQTPRVSIIVRRTSLAKRPLGRRELKSFIDWSDGQASTELNFKLYRQATNKIIGISGAAADFISEHF